MYFDFTPERKTQNVVGSKQSNVLHRADILAFIRIRFLSQLGSLFLLLTRVKVMVFSELAVNDIIPKHNK